MPVTDLNAEKMIDGVMNSIEAVETTTEFLRINADLPAIMITTVIIIGIFAALFVFGWFLISKALKNVNR